MKDPIVAMSANQLAELAIDLQVQLEKGTGTRPVLWLLVRARERAAEAMKLLVQAKATDTVGIITLQSQIQYYEDLVCDCQALLTRGREADRELDEQIRIEIADTLDLEEAKSLGLTQTAEDF